MTKPAAPRKKRVHVVLVLAGALAIPADASAHLVNTGLGPIYDGVAHFAMSPEAILPIISLGIFAGLRGVVHARASVTSLPVAWVAFGLLGMLFGPVAISPAYESLPLLMLGGLAAADIRMPAWCTALLAVLLGAFEGYNFGAAYSATRDGLPAVIGSVGLVFVLIALASAAVLKAKWNWTRVAMRVVGSWTAASGMLLLGWGLR